MRKSSKKSIEEVKTMIPRSWDFFDNVYDPASRMNELTDEHLFLLRHKYIGLCAGFKLRNEHVSWAYFRRGLIDGELHRRGLLNVG